MKSFVRHLGLLDVTWAGMTATKQCGQRLANVDGYARKQYPSSFGLLVGNYVVNLFCVLCWSISGA